MLYILWGEVCGAESVLHGSLGGGASKLILSCHGVVLKLDTLCVSSSLAPREPGDEAKSACSEPIKSSKNCSDA